MLAYTAVIELIVVLLSGGDVETVVVVPTEVEVIVEVKVEVLVIVLRIKTQLTPFHRWNRNRNWYHHRWRLRDTYYTR